MRVGFLCALLAAVVGLSAAFADTDSATATVAPKECGGIEAGGKSYVVKAHLVKCRFARRWSRKVLTDDGRPDGWECDRYGKRSDIAFVCRKPGKDFFAIRD